MVLVQENMFTYSFIVLLQLSILEYRQRKKEGRPLDSPGSCETNLSNFKGDSTSNDSIPEKIEKKCDESTESNPVDNTGV